MAGAYEEAILGGRRIALARESAFRLGRAHVQPSTRTLEVDGRAEIIEPRMMQVLVALAGAKGEVVTRDELLELCWEGRVVGEDALSRVLWRLRQVLASLGQPGFEIETIPRVGYRLVVDARAELQPTPGVAPATNRVSRRTIAGGLVAVAGAAAIGSFAWAGDHRHHEPVAEAKRYYDRAAALLGQSNYVECQQSLAFLREAVRIDPDYSEAWGALALGYSNLLNWYSPRPDTNQLKIAARSAARRALDLDPDNPDAPSALLTLDSPYGRWAEVERGLRELLSKHPSHICSRLALASLMIETGRLTAALEIFKTVTASEPFWAAAKWRVADLLLALGRLQEAEEQIDIGERLWPRSFNFWVARMEHLLISGREEEAMRIAHDRASLPLDAPELVHREVLVAEARASHSASAVARAREVLVSLAKGPQRELAIPAMELPFFGEVDLSFELYEGYFFNRGPWATGPYERYYTGGLFEALTENLRKDARFMPLLREIGLDRYYRLAGVKPDFLQA
jgi:DNA-binding winged helix-turn-helix (wHTH) protein/tetratricopeptide (TPR) repeat protein